MVTCKKCGTTDQVSPDRLCDLCWRYSGEGMD